MYSHHSVCMCGAYVVYAEINDKLQEAHVVGSKVSQANGLVLMGDV